MMTDFIFVAGGIASIVFLVILLAILNPKKKDKRDTLRGSARWATKQDLEKAGLFAKRPFKLGKAFGRELSWGSYAIGQHGHIATVAPSRAGKGVSFVIPNLLRFNSSVFVLDVKGENAKATATMRSEVTEVHIIDPFDVTEEGYSCFDPMSYIHEFEDANYIAEMLEADSTTGGDSFFSEKARQLLALFLWFLHEKNHPFWFLSELLAGDVTEKLNKMTEDFESSQGKQKASSFFVEAQQGEKTFSSILSTARKSTDWIATDTMQKHFRENGLVNFEKMFDEKQSVYLVIPPERLETMRGFTRLMIGCAIGSLIRFRGQKRNSVLFVLDEFPSLGKFKPVETGIGYLAGYGVQLWLFAQDLSQLRKIYGHDGSQSLLSQCELEVFFSIKEQATAELVSRRLGRQTLHLERSPHSGTKVHEKSDFNTTEESRDLLTPDEVVGFEDAIAFVKGLPPVKFQRHAFFDK